eukprot:Gb_26943 [translate_table: standard]
MRRMGMFSGDQSWNWRGEIQNFSDQIWPQGNPNFCKIIEDYISNMERLTKTVFKIVLISAGLSKYYTSHFDNSHTDANCMTIINQDSMGGLEVLSNEGQWVAAKPLPNSFVVIIGDPLMAWSNGRFHNVKHRVIIDGWKTRISLPFVVLFPNELEISPPPELVDDEHPQLYRIFKSAEYRKFREEEYREIEGGEYLKLDSPIDVFARLSTHE